MKGKVVLAQMEYDGAPEKNMKKAKSAVEKAVTTYRPDMIVFPEFFMSRFQTGTKREVCLGTAQSISGAFVTYMRQLAKENRVWIVFGMNEKIESACDDRNYNCTVVLNSDGAIVAKYRKTHLYDAFGYKESDNIKSGDRLFEPVETPLGRMGLFVCYEVRFPEIARYQCSKSADFIVMPTAWMPGPLKSSQFRTLVSARAIENCVYMIACDQVGLDAMGESMIVDPMGVVIAGGSEVETLICAEIDTERVKAVRNKVPALRDRRTELYAI